MHEEDENGFTLLTGQGVEITIRQNGNCVELTAEEGYRVISRLSLDNPGRCFLWVEKNVH